MIENNVAITASLVVYMAVCLLLGALAYRRTDSLGDFILGGRKLGSWVTALSCAGFRHERLAADGAARASPTCPASIPSG